jgi:hypothetical protein
VVSNNRVSQFFKRVSQKLSIFTKTKKDEAVLKVNTKQISETVDSQNKKHKSRWSNSNWWAKIFSSTSNELTKEQREILAKNWFGNFSPIGKFYFARGSKTKKTPRLV